MPSAHRFDFTPVLLALIVGGGMALAMLATGQALTAGGWRLATAVSAIALGTSSIYFTVQNLRQARALAAASPEAGYLITEGIFSATRNPMCLGLSVALFGLAKLFESPWGYSAPAAFFVLVQWIHIRPEEARLAAWYGEQYQTYKSQVRRWV
jgi:protein-S-isoprenylcysteine O-methyltransferase Ste14